MKDDQIENLQPAEDEPTDVVDFDDSSGISEEDQEEIRTTIDQIVQENKIPPRPPKVDHP